MSSKSPQKTAPKKPKTPSAQKLTNPNGEGQLALSELHLRREHLEQEKQWLLKQISRKQKELSNFVEQMREIATEIFQSSRPYVEKITQLSEEVHQFFSDIFSGRKLGKRNQQKIQEVYETLQETGVILPPQEEDSDDLDDLFDEESEEEDFDDADERDFDEEAHRYSRYHPSEKPEPRWEKKEDIRHIRQTFLRLAEVFHPDKINERTLLGKVNRSILFG